MRQLLSGSELLVVQIFKNMSIFDFLKIILNRIEKLYKYYCLKNKNFSVNFFHEGDTVIKLPKVAFWQTILGKWSILKRNSDFASRPTSEVLLRKTIYQMYQSGYICSQLSIIDDIIIVLFGQSFFPTMEKYLP